MNTERIQKILASNGYGSRREIEKLILEGKVIVDNKVATIGQRINQDQKVKINNKDITITKSLPDKVIIYNKPKGEICSKKDPKNRGSVYDNLPKLPKGSRWVMVGRLDINSEGLLIFTTNGEYANYLMHPRAKIPRTYKVRVHGEINDTQITALLKGVRLEDGVSNFDNIKVIGGSGRNNWYEVTISSGKNRIIRRMIESQGLMVNRLIRVTYGPYNLPESLKLGQSIAINKK